MFVMTSLTTVKIQKQPRCPSTDGWIKKIWHIHMTDYHSAIKKNEILPRSATQMHLEGIVLNDLRQRKTSII